MYLVDDVDVFQPCQNALPAGLCRMCHSGFVGDTAGKMKKTRN